MSSAWQMSETPGNTVENVVRRPVVVFHCVISASLHTVLRIRFRYFVMVGGDDGDATSPDDEA